MRLSLPLLILFGSKVIAMSLYERHIDTFLEDIINYPSAYIPKMENKPHNCEFAFYTEFGWSPFGSYRFTKMKPFEYEKALIYQDAYARENYMKEYFPRYRHLYVEVPETSKQSLLHTS